MFPVHGAPKQTIYREKSRRTTLLSADTVLCLTHFQVFIDPLQGEIIETDHLTVVAAGFLHSVPGLLNS